MSVQIHIYCNFICCEFGVVFAADMERSVTIFWLIWKYGLSANGRHAVPPGNVDGSGLRFL
jgi:hypothetical protein